MVNVLRQVTLVVPEYNATQTSINYPRPAVCACQRSSSLLFRKIDAFDVSDFADIRNLRAVLPACRFISEELGGLSVNDRAV